MNTETPTPVRRRGVKKLHAATIAVIVAGVVIVGGATIVTEVLHRDTEQRLLDQRTGEAGAVLSTAISGLQTPLSSAAELAETTNGDPDAFRAVMGRLVGRATGNRFVAAQLYSASSTTPIVSMGDPTALAAAGPVGVQAMLDKAAAAQALSVNDLLDQPERRLGYAYKSVQTPTRFVVYAETAVPQRTSASRTTGPFQDLEYATYIDRATSDELLYASVGEVPIKGRTSTTAVPFGDRQLVLVTTTSAILAGQLSRLLPYLIAIVGAILIVVGALVTQLLLRRRSQAVALADDVSRLYEDQRHRTETLQRSLLPRELPQPPGVQVAARYWPADKTSEIGGDFYDLFEIESGRWGVTIGDVCGKGIEAAALTGVTRHTIRAAARHLDSPADVLGWTYEAIRGYDSETYATVCFGFLRLIDNRAELDIALAGHPGPLLYRSAGTVEALGARGTVLGLVQPHVSRTRYSIAAGDTVIFYTDGITDAPGEQAVPLNELEDAVRQSVHSGPTGMVDAIRARIESHRPGGSGDDTAILVLQFDDRTVNEGQVRTEDVIAGQREQSSVG
jgi:serine phosphatase RsbU (regulator of sigma subunit)